MDAVPLMKSVVMCCKTAAPGSMTTVGMPARSSDRISSVDRAPTETTDLFRQGTSTPLARHRRDDYDEVQLVPTQHIGVRGRNDATVDVADTVDPNVGEVAGTAQDAELQT